jgi:hypothetical protein
MRRVSEGEVLGGESGFDLRRADNTEGARTGMVFPHTRVLLDDQATETNVRTIERPLVLHMATHGFFGEARNERDNPMFRSGLYLADIDQVKVDRERDDGQLTAYEVSGMDLRGTQLVVLSACETGLGATVKAEGKELMSEGVSGLRRAFAMAGARTAVMSLWAVSGVTAQRRARARRCRRCNLRCCAARSMPLSRTERRSSSRRTTRSWCVPAGQKPRGAEDELPPTDDRGGCATTPLGRGAPMGSMLIGLLGLLALRRKSR